ncbi:MAG TPA: UbiA-like polyprenyltransferase [Coriobacteriia bacterium]
MSDTSAPKPGKLKILTELVKFEHSIFALPYAYVGAVYGAAAVAFAVPAIYPAPAPQPTPWVTLANWPTWSALLWITVAMVGARAVAFTLNRAIDKEIDARNPRTAGRAVPSGLIKAWELWAFSILMLAAYLVAVYNLAPITHWLWPIPLAMFIVYPYLKRFTPFAHFWLGACLGLGVVGGWAGVADSVSALAPWVLGAAVAIWTAGFDIIYATQDYQSDLDDGVHSVPADFGIARALLTARVLHVLTVVLFAWGGWLVGAGVWYYVGIVAAGMMLAYENTIVRPDDLSRLDTAFFTVNGFVAVVAFAGVLVDRLVR